MLSPKLPDMFILRALRATGWERLAAGVVFQKEGKQASISRRVVLKCLPILCFIFTLLNVLACLNCNTVVAVTGKGKGTPLLRSGVKLIGRQDDEESEASDWHGFD